MRIRFFVVAFLVSTSLFAADAAPSLREFLYAMPKGGDLHNHLSGAVYAETFLDLARRDGMCFDATRAIVPCGDGATPIDKAFTESSV